MLDRLRQSSKAYEAEDPFGGRESDVLVGFGFAEDQILLDTVGESNFEALKGGKVVVECRSYDYDSITVSSAWELASVYMRYSQGDGVHTPLSRLVLYPRSVIIVVIIVCVCVDYARHGHVLYGTRIIRTMYVHELYLQG